MDDIWQKKEDMQLCTSSRKTSLGDWASEEPRKEGYAGARGSDAESFITDAAHAADRSRSLLG